MQRLRGPISRSLCPGHTHSLYWSRLMWLHVTQRPFQTDLNDKGKVLFQPKLVRLKRRRLTELLKGRLQRLSFSLCLFFILSSTGHPPSTFQLSPPGSSARHPDSTLPRRRQHTDNSKPTFMSSSFSCWSFTVSLIQQKFL